MPKRIRIRLKYGYSSVSTKCESLNIEYSNTKVQLYNEGVNNQLIEADILLSKQTTDITKLLSYAPSVERRGFKILIEREEYDILDRSLRTYWYFEPKESPINYANWGRAVYETMTFVRRRMPK